MKSSFSKFESRSIGKKLSQLSLKSETAKICRKRNLPVNDLVGVQDTLGEPTGKFNYLVWYTKPESAETPFSAIKPTGWGKEFSDTNDQVSILCLIILQKL